MTECIANMNENNNNGAIFKPAKPVFRAGSIHRANYNQQFGGIGHM